MQIDFQHQQSAHCENGVISNLMNHKGIKVSEPLVFGIGAGLFFVYLPFLKVNFAPGFSYRPMPGFIFRRFAKQLGIKVIHKKFNSEKEAQKVLDEKLNQGIPVGLQVGVYHLTYFPDEYRFHFNAHNLVVYGKEENRYLISDPVMDTTTSLSDKELGKVRFAKGALPPKGHLYYLESVPTQYDWEKAIKKGINKTCRDMLAPVPIVGVNAMKWVAKNIKKWPKKIGAKKTNHYLGQLVRMQEEIGTGGGGFRFIYAAFLEEASQILNNPKLKELSKEMTEIGDEWRDFALNISRVYKNRSKETDIYDKLSDQLLGLAERERMFFQELRKAV
ncbi:BtrH N-terminal domain-containing protein [Moheibacter lacus]|uniref:BtrH N-terminal domain-containing protein n=1 Tax=Moheibacter lacus TaxID=2745851 RepID=A0A838ZR59_9FLAO|nr:BtrH N-terminal domain-containing protein [Moheibacter lacus]MBA5628772.1 BtrH N-terminal domain-containing protein [Moheibacter lacus]